MLQRPVIFNIASGRRAPSSSGWTKLHRSPSDRPRSAQHSPRQDSPPADAAWSFPGSARSTASAPAARRARLALASRLCVPRQLDQVDQSHIGFARLGREARHDVAEVGGIELRVLVDLAGKESRAERAKGHKPDTKFLQRRKNSASGPRQKSEYSLCSAVTGWTA